MGLSLGRDPFAREAPVGDDFGGVFDEGVHGQHIARTFRDHQPEAHRALFALQRHKAQAAAVGARMRICGGPTRWSTKTPSRSCVRGDGHATSHAPSSENRACHAWPQPDWFDYAGLPEQTERLNANGG